MPPLPPPSHPIARTRSTQSQARSEHSVHVVSTVAQAPRPSVADVEHISLDMDEGMEEIDFTDMGKLVGVEKPSEGLESSLEAPEKSAVPQDGPSRRPPRPVTSDFLDGGPLATESSVLMRSDAVSSWRRKAGGAVDEQSLASVPEGRSDETVTATKTASSVVESSPESSVKPLPSIAESHISAGHTGLKAHRPPPGASQYREASMSALDDTITRIKGALSHMHTTDRSREPSGSEHLAGAEPRHSEKPELPLIKTEFTTPAHTKVEPTKPQVWIPPNRRPEGFVRREREARASVPSEPTFLPPPPPPPRDFATSSEPEPASPRAWNVHVVKFPKHFVPRWPPVTARQQMAYFRPTTRSLRWENLLSFDPPVEGMRPQTLSLNDVLFKRPPPPSYNGKVKYKVYISKERLTPYQPAREEPSVPTRPASITPSTSEPNAVATTVPLANPPPPPPLSRTASINGSGAFGRPREADDLPSWRQKAAPPPSQPSPPSPAPIDQLETVSRSPPPEADPPPAYSASRWGEAVSASRWHRALEVRTLSEESESAGVAVYHSTPPGPGRFLPNPSRSFTVASELEESQRPPTPRTSLARLAAAMTNPELTRGMTGAHSTGQQSSQAHPSVEGSKENGTGSKSSEGSVSAMLINIFIEIFD